MESAPFDRGLGGYPPLGRRATAPLGLEPRTSPLVTEALFPAELRGRKSIQPALVSRNSAWKSRMRKFGQAHPASDIASKTSWPRLTDTLGIDIFQNV